MKREVKIYHAYIKDSEYNFYFGSLKALHEQLNHIINLSYNYLALKMSNKDVFETDKIKVIRSILITQPKNQQQKT